MDSVCGGITAYKHGITATIAHLYKLKIGGVTVSKVVPMKFNDVELDMLNRCFAASGAKHLSTHIKEVYFAAMRPGTDSFVGLEGQLTAIEGMLAQLVDRQQDLGGSRDEGLLLTLVAGIFHMLHGSVEPARRMLVDKTVNVQEVEQFLKGTV